jgi:hypothetical protein
MTKVVNLPKNVIKEGFFGDVTKQGEVKKQGAVTNRRFAQCQCTQERDGWLVFECDARV